ncbi:MAG: TIGR03960 family B12-binding radical SAM protein [Planctomycetes bacterium]|nr:TIGR03960 family B12-binding radical SAM protein [Planctomycetota bacterium]
MGELPDLVSTELLPSVQKPGQYIGREVNQLVRDGDWQAATVRTAIAFPDTYAVGMSHLGCQILYWIVNHLEDCCAERVYCPWSDAEAVMRTKNIPLFTWDTRQPVSTADILAITLQHEMAFTGVLQLLDLAGIPLRSTERDDSHPLILAGGPQADNPEPLAPFLDLVVLGDGEESIAAIHTAYRELKIGGVRRRDAISTLASRFDWLYATGDHYIRYNADSTVHSITSADGSTAKSIQRCQTPDFDNAPVHLQPLVPHTEAIHDRIAIEIMRGCPERCRFCHAGYTKRPLRLRSVDRILEIAEHAYNSTGMDELGILSLSTADYPHLAELAKRINDRFTPRRVNISVPSLRIDRMLRDIPWMVNSVRKSGLTLAVEAARDDLRAAIRKRVTDADLLEGVRAAYRAGWRSIKLYFMCGFPGEQPQDIEGIVDLSRRVSEIRQELGRGPANINVSVGWLVPKPHTPFQWAGQADAEYFRETRRHLMDLLNSSGRRPGKRGPVKIRTHNIERSVLEAVFARGDRRLSDVIEHAYRAGARFDSWDECFNSMTWTRAFEAASLDPGWYANRERPRDEVFPWSHLAGGVSNEYLLRQYDDYWQRLSSTRPNLIRSDSSDSVPPT